MTARTCAVRPHNRTLPPRRPPAFEATTERLRADVDVLRSLDERMLDHWLERELTRVLVRFVVGLNIDQVQP